MSVYLIEVGSPGITIDSVFQTIFDTLEQLQQTSTEAENIAPYIVNCARELRNLQRIHGPRWKFYGQDCSEDPFELNDMLKKFLSSCNTFLYMNSAAFGADEEERGGGRDGCFIPVPQKKSWKKKHFAALEEDFYEHQRILSLALSNAIYTTTISMQLAAHAPDPIIIQLLTQSERRQSRLARLPSKVKNGHLKPIETSLEEMDWEVCLKRYFDFVESWLPPSSAMTVDSDLSRYPRLLTSGSTQRSPSAGSNYSEADRKTDDIDLSIYYRKPRRRNSMSSRASDDDYDDRRTSSLQSTTNTTTLVPFSPSRATSMTASSTSTMTGPPRHIRRTSITGDFQWEFTGRSSTFSLLAPLAAQWPILKDAQVDIYTQTQNMNNLEARAYAQGRLASLPPDIIQEVRRVLTVRDRIASAQPKDQANQQWSPPQLSKPVFHSGVPLQLQPAPHPQPQPQSQYLLQLGPSQLQSIRNEQQAELRTPVSAPMPLRVRNTTLNRASTAPLPSKVKLGTTPLPKHEPPRRASSTPTPARVSDSFTVTNAPLPNRLRFKSSWKVPFQVLADLRPLTAISERPSTSRTARSRADSVDKPPSITTSVVPSFRRRSTLSQQVLPLPPLPGNEADVCAIGSSGSSGSSGTNSLVSSKSNASKASSSATDVSGADQNANKPLPKIPRLSLARELFARLKPEQEKSLKQQEQEFESRFGAFLAKRSPILTRRKPVPGSTYSTVSSLGNRSKTTLPSNASYETLGRVSIEFLRRKDSRATLAAVAEEPAFKLWLTALQYIEGT